MLEYALRIYRILSDMTHRMTPCCELKERIGKQRVLPTTLKDEDCRRFIDHGKRQTNFGVVKLPNILSKMNNHVATYSYTKTFFVCLAFESKFQNLKSATVVI